MGKLTGQVALITGAARGLGEAAARALLAEGAQVVLGDVLDELGSGLAADLGAAASYVHLDVTSEQDWAAAVTAADRIGGADVLVNNAGIVAFGGVVGLAPADFRRVVEVNLVGVFLGLHTVVPGMLARGRGGAVINVSSTAGMMGYPNAAGYVASKWGVRGLTKAAALDLARTGIRVCSVHPGPIRTAMTEGLPESFWTSQPIPRIGEPEEVARAIVYLAADATYTTGSELLVDGGSLLGPAPEAG